jgi:hypothetical protein
MVMRYTRDYLSSSEYLKKSSEKKKISIQNLLKIDLHA